VTHSPGINIEPVARVATRVEAAVSAELARTRGLLRLAPCWVPRSFLQPGLRLKLHPDDIYAYGVDRGGIDERWFGSTTETANEGRSEDEGLSYVVLPSGRCTLRDAIAATGPAIVGEEIWRKYGRWPVYSKFFDNRGPIPHHLHQTDEQARLVGRMGKPEAYYFPPQLNSTGNNFPYTFFGLEPGTTKQQLRACLERWNDGDNGILDLSRAYRLKPGTGWIVPPGILHAPGSLCTYEPQWGSDVFAMYQSVVEGRRVPWELLVKDVPESRHRDLDFLVDLVDLEANLDPAFKRRHFLEPRHAGGSKEEGWVDRWVVYGRIRGAQPFAAKELTIEPGRTAVVRDAGAYALVCVQGNGAINGEPLSSPSLIRFGQLTDDEYFCSSDGARAGVRFENRSLTEPLVCLRYFGPEANPAAPDIE
jgi:hypothetical protein